MDTNYFNEYVDKLRRLMLNDTTKTNPNIGNIENKALSINLTEQSIDLSPVITPDSNKNISYDIISKDELIDKKRRMSVISEINNQYFSNSSLISITSEYPRDKQKLKLIYFDLIDLSHQVDDYYFKWTTRNSAQLIQAFVNIRQLMFDRLSEIYPTISVKYDPHNNISDLIDLYFTIIQEDNTFYPIYQFTEELAKIDLLIAEAKIMINDIKIK